jgi:hypothetical protein
LGDVDRPVLAVVGYTTFTGHDVYIVDHAVCFSLGVIQHG